MFSYFIKKNYIKICVDFRANENICNIDVMSSCFTFELKIHTTLCLAIICNVI